MSEPEITYLTDIALLTIVVQAGRSDAVLKSAREIGAVTGAIGYRVHGIGARERLGLISVAIEAEREVISLLVATDQIDVVIDHLYRGAKLGVPGSGYIFATSLEKVATYVPEGLRKRLDDSKDLATPSS